MAWPTNALAGAILKGDNMKGHMSGSMHGKRDTGSYAMPSRDASRPGSPQGGTGPGGYPSPAANKKVQQGGRTGVSQVAINTQSYRSTQPVSVRIQPWLDITP